MTGQDVVRDPRDRFIAVVLAAGGTVEMHEGRVRVVLPTGGVVQFGVDRSPDPEDRPYEIRLDADERAGR